jgi:hypothetical protein
MKKENVITMLSCAVATTSLIVTCMRPETLDGESDVPVISQPESPKLVVGNVELRLKSASNSLFEAGQKPALELTAENLGEEAADEKIKVLITTSAPASPLSRLVVLPEVLWTHNEDLQLKAGEKKSFTLKCDKPLPPGRVISVVLQTGTPGTDLMPRLEIQGASPGPKQPSSIVAITGSTGTNAISSTRSASDGVARL